MSQESWDRFFFDMVGTVATKSKDRSTKVGTVIVGPDNEVRTLGYNGFPRGVEDEIDSRHERPVKYFYAEHAERNAIYNAARVGIPLKGCSIYLDWPPCADCARAIIQSGISRVAIDAEKFDARKTDLLSRWGDSLEISEEMLREAGVDVDYVYFGAETCSNQSFLQAKRAFSGRSTHGNAQG